MNIEKTESWKSAEFRYGEIIAMDMIPFAPFKLSEEERIKEYERILKSCPKFYPVILELGLRYLMKNEMEEGKEKIKEGLNLLLEIADPKHIDEEIDALISNLERIWRFDLSMDCLLILIKHFPDKPDYYDMLAYASMMIGDSKTALSSILKAIELKPENTHYKANLGWVHLRSGNLKQAEDSLNEALQVDPKNEHVKFNLSVLKYLRKNGGKYIDYLLRPVEREKIEKLIKKDEWDKANDIRNAINSDRFEALTLNTIQKNMDKIGISNKISTLRIFFSFVENIDNNGDFMLYDDIYFIHDNFKRIMHKYIFKFGDIDKTIMDETYESLLIFYEFLAQSNLISIEEFESFKGKILDIKQELIDKMEKYNRIRHDENINEEEKEKIREELFEGDHVWMFL